MVCESDYLLNCVITLDIEESEIYFMYKLSELISNLLKIFSEIGFFSGVIRRLEYVSWLKANRC